MCTGPSPTGLAHYAVVTRPACPWTQLPNWINLPAPYTQWPPPCTGLGHVPYYWTCPPPVRSGRPHARDWATLLDLPAPCTQWPPPCTGLGHLTGLAHPLSGLGHLTAWTYHPLYAVAAPMHGTG